VSSTGLTEGGEHELGVAMTTYDIGTTPFGEPTILEGRELEAARRDSAPLRGILFGLALVTPLWVGAGIGVAVLLSL
jgi:hypothetical protein